VSRSSQHLKRLGSLRSTSCSIARVKSLGLSTNPTAILDPLTLSPRPTSGLATIRELTLGKFPQGRLGVSRQSGLLPDVPSLGHKVKAWRRSKIYRNAPEKFFIEWRLSFCVGCDAMANLSKNPIGKPGVPKQPQPVRNCQPFSQIVVSAFAPGTQPETVKCTSNRPFLVYCSTNFSLSPPAGWGYSVSVKGTGFAGGSLAPTYIVGGPANDVITFIFSPGVTGFLTLQTECGAKASITG
jgi:hypothetical protein